jgi:hypothetical protein
MFSAYRCVFVPMLLRMMDRVHSQCTEKVYRIHSTLYPDNLPMYDIVFIDRWCFNQAGLCGCHDLIIL